MSKDTDAKQKVSRRHHTLRRFVEVGREHYGLTSSAHHVWMVLWSHADFDGYCQISQARLAKSTGLSLPTVKRCIKQLLITKAIIQVVKGSSLKGVSKYHIKYFGKKRS